MKYLLKFLILLFGTLSFSQELIFENLFDSSLSSEIACYRIPSIITSTNGTLIAAYITDFSGYGDSSSISLIYL